MYELYAMEIAGGGFALLWDAERSVIHRASWRPDGRLSYWVRLVCNASDLRALAELAEFAEAFA